MKAYWWKDVPNFGDRLSPLLLREFAGVKVQWAEISQADIISTGSILHHAPNDWHGIVLGSGLLRADLAHTIWGARVMALRGPRTARAMGWSDMPYGDPGLLADELVGSLSKRWDIGILPHWSDSGLARDPRFLKLPYKMKYIDPTDDPIRVVRQIGQCEKLVTSSLHGVIVADAFGIPRRIETTPLFDLDTMFKFEDYHESIGHEFVTGRTTKAHRGRVEDAKHAIYDAFQELR